jgi:perosamine synthetase|tara:strand:- start:1186 stop:2340 length:1155 start_codon:yes stop_codon:yes gene_type:complete
MVLVLDIVNMSQNIKIPVAAPKFLGNEIDYVTDCVKSTWISSQGEYVSRFEESFSKYCGVNHGVSTSSGTTALHLALATLDLKPDDEVIIPSFTMIATANSVSYTGAKPVLVDSEPKFWNIDVNKIEEKINKKTKVIMPVHTYGHPCDMDVIHKLAKDYGLYVIEDAAEAHGAEYKGKKTGSLSDIACFSFYANKIITTGEGGMLVTNNEELAKKSITLRAHSFSADMHFWHRHIGFGYRLSSLQAAVGLAQLENIEKFVNIRRNNAHLYSKLLGEIKGITLPPEAEWAKNVYWMYSILIEDNFGMDLDTFMSKLRDYGIDSRTFFYPIHIQPIYKDKYLNEIFPVANELSKKGINLPSGNNLEKKQIEYIVSCIKEIKTDNKK